MAGDSPEVIAGANGHEHGRTKSARTDSLVSNIITIRKDKEELDLLKAIRSGLRPADGGKKSLPTLLLYDAAGLKIYEKLTYLEEYYLLNAELEVLEKHAHRIAERIKPNSIILELGSGNLRKIKILLDAIEAASKPVEYYALDVSLDELARTLQAVPPGTFKYVKCFGLHGTYDDGLEWIKSEPVRSRPKAVLSMGSSIGNFSRADAASFLSSFSAALQPGDELLIGIDGCKDPEKITLAYNDPHGVTHDFVLNGLVHANRLLGRQDFAIADWRVNGEYNSSIGGHEAHVYPVHDVSIDGVLIKANEQIWFEHSLKYDGSERAQLWEAAGLTEGASWMNSDSTYGLHMAYKPSFQFPLRPEQYAATPVPLFAEWQELWEAWDAVTQQMIPKKELREKPIKLRNACIFYLGHIPTFLAIHLHKASGEGVKGLFEYQRIFERGIDPDVDNPELCHAHSEIPEQWPEEAEILAFQALVRAQVKKIYASNEHDTQFAVRKALWLGFEHEVMHLETLLYMLVQSEKTLPPPGSIHPDFGAMAEAAFAKAVPNQWFEIPARTISLGLNDDDHDVATKRYYGWDNEKPARKAEVKRFRVQARPITNGEYAQFLEDRKLPKSWAQSESRSNEVNGHANGASNGITCGTVDGDVNCSSFADGKFVRTVFGPVPLKFALDWPVMASYDELAAYAAWHGGRIPTMEEVKSIYEYAEEQKAKDFENALGKTIPAVNGHLINDGVEETPPPHSSVNGASGTVSPDPHSLFVNLEGANVGFKHWHPIPVTSQGDKLAGHGEMGGVWEWTSTVLEKHEGFEPMELYPGYTADFFDKKHNVVLGGSWATHPRIAGRKSFVNWYQRNYPYVWAGARLARDV